MSDQEIRTQSFRALIALIGFFILVLILGILFRPWIEQFTERVYATLGFSGLVIFTFVNDAVVSPIPPATILLLISQSELKDRWILPIFIIGLSSACAGGLGWWLGAKLRETRIPKMLFGKKLEEGEAFARRYGALGVALGALTPMPYSLTTWTAGMLNTPFRAVFFASLLRIPNIFVYYLAVAGALDIGEILQALFASWRS